jgi:ADP-heptose:LPS heptosyltransferase
VRVVILRALKLGDFLTAVPAYRAIRRAFPRARLILAAPNDFTPLLELMDGAVDEIADVRELGPLPAQTRDAGLAVNLHGAGPESHRTLLNAGARRLMAFRHHAVAESAGGPAYDPHEHEVARWCRLLESADIPADPRELDLRIPPENVPPSVRGATLFHPGAASESRRWPAERWIALARSEVALGRRVVITGGPSEVERARFIASASGIPPSFVFAGRTNVRELAALVAASGRIVCGDTGVAHLATALRRPSVLLFGPTPPALWGPPARPYHRVIWAGSQGDPHAESVDAGLLAIGVEQVVAELAASSG